MFPSSILPSLSSSSPSSLSSPNPWYDVKKYLLNLPSRGRKWHHEKILVVGDSSSGKSTLIECLQQLNCRFNPENYQKTMIKLNSTVGSHNLLFMKSNINGLVSPQHSNVSAPPTPTPYDAGLDTITTTPPTPTTPTPLSPLTCSTTNVLGILNDKENGGGGGGGGGGGVVGGGNPVNNINQPTTNLAKTRGLLKNSMGLGGTPSRDKEIKNTFSQLLIQFHDSVKIKKLKFIKNIPKYTVWDFADCSNSAIHSLFTNGSFLFPSPPLSLSPSYFLLLLLISYSPSSFFSFFSFSFLFHFLLSSSYLLLFLPISYFLLLPYSVPYYFPCPCLNNN